VDALLTRRRMSHLMEPSYDPKAKTYTLDNLFSDLDQAIFTELYSGKKVDFYRRNLQKLYVMRLIQQSFTQDDKGMITPGAYKLGGSDMQGLIRNALRGHQQLFKRALQSPSIDKLTRIHLQEMNDSIEKKFNEKK
jgi:hypothetical protein